MFDQGRAPQDLESEHLEHEIATLAAHIYAATCRWLLLIAEFDRRRCFESWGFHSTTAWLAWTCGLTARAAREHVRVARDLVALPAVSFSFSRGEISYSKVRALTRVAEPETEAELLELAHHATAAQLERTVRAFSSALAVAEDRPPPDTFFAWDWEDDGTLSIRGRLVAEDGALLIEAMRHAHDVLGGRGRGTAPLVGPGGEPASQRNTDALAALAEAALTSTGSSAGGDRYQVVLHVDRVGRRELDEGSSLGADVTRRLLCDAAVVAVVEEGGSPVSVGRRTRTIPSSVRRALRARDEGCRFPGCTHHRFVDAHHVTHWADGGETSLHNLVQLCRRHHRLIHEGKFSIATVDDGEPEFRDRNGLALRARPTA